MPLARPEKGAAARREDGVSDGTPQGKLREDEPSDLFSVKPYESSSAIPRIEKVPLTKEELRKRLLLRITYGVLAAATVALGIWLYVFLSHLAEVKGAVQAAGDDGRAASARAAIALLEGDGDAESRAVALRIRAMLVLAGEEQDAAAVRSALEALPDGDEDIERERRIARTYLALADGQLATAMQEASGIVARGDHAAEAARARALAAWFVGNVEQALAAARIAVDQRPEAPRHVALFAELTARSGRVREALARLDDVPEERRNAATRIARARIMDREGGRQSEVSELAEAVLEDGAATAHEKAWARLLLARTAATAGDRVTARQHLEQAAQAAPGGDELFTLALTEAALRIESDHLAQRFAERLPSPLSVDAGRRAQLSAELALARRELRTAEAALQTAPAGARTSLARARLLEARGQFDEARRLYLEAAADAAYRVPATVSLAAMELAQGNAREAVERITPLLTEHENHPDVVPVAVEAQLGLGNPQRAMEIVTPALDAYPSDVRLLAAKAHVQMALEQWEQALATLDSALRIEDDEADLHADRGRAARRLSRNEVAREAFDAALALNESHPVALLGRLELDVHELEPALGRQVLDRLDRAEVRSLELERLRGRLLVMENAGQSGVNEMRRAITRYGDDPTLVVSLAWLYVQAEQYSTAVRWFGRVIEGQEPLEAVLGRVLAQIRMRASAPARSTMDAVLDSVDESALDAETRAELHAVLARLAHAGDNRVQAAAEAQRALELDPKNGEAHLVLADLAADREQDDTAHLEAALDARRPPSRPLAVLAMRADPVTDAACDYARRYRRAAPAGQFARGVARVLRDCRRADRASDD